MAPPFPPEVELTNELLLSASELPVFIVTVPPLLGDTPFTSESRWRVTLAPLCNSSTRLRCCASSTAPSPPDKICKVIEPTTTGEPPRWSTWPGGKKSASAPPCGAASIAARSCAVVPTVVKPFGPGTSGGIGGSAGGAGGEGGAVGIRAQPGTSIPASRHVVGHSWLIAESLAAGGVNASGQPKAIARSLKCATLLRQATFQLPKSVVAIDMPCVHSVPPAQIAIEANVPGTSGHALPLPPVLE
eukprot:5842893-Prymnesium_polylepis.1